MLHHEMYCLVFIIIICGCSSFCPCGVFPPPPLFLVNNKVIQSWNDNNNHFWKNCPFKAMSGSG